ncbi:MAG TPA: hypothetical protein VG917_05630 [Patescibacteria group bacterium]|nr:hypothetical protein [Patescibacteria group bacterium]
MSEFRQYNVYDRWVDPEFNPQSGIANEKDIYSLNVYLGPTGRKAFHNLADIFGVEPNEKLVEYALKTTADFCISARDGEDLVASLKSSKEGYKPESPILAAARNGSPEIDVLYSYAKEKRIAQAQGNILKVGLNVEAQKYVDQIVGMIRIKGHEIIADHAIRIAEWAASKVDGGYTLYKMNPQTRRATTYSGVFFTHNNISLLDSLASKDIEVVYSDQLSNNA